jgi:hypothetical protein
MLLLVLGFLLFLSPRVDAHCDDNCTRKCQACGEAFGRRVCSPPEPTCVTVCITKKAICTGVQASQKDAPFHGNYCGYGNTDATYGKSAVDELDGACKRHDQCWDRRARFSCTCNIALTAEATAISVSGVVPSSVREKAGLVAAFFKDAPCTPP